MEDKALTLEDALEAVQRSVEEVTTRANRLAAAGKKAAKAAAVGDLKALRSTLGTLVDIADQADEAAVQAVAAWTFKTEAGEEKYFEDGHYQTELLAAAREARLGLYDMDGVLASFPSLVRIVAKDRSVTIDRKPFRLVRPSYLVKHLQAVQDRPSRTNFNQFLEALHRAYQLTIAEKGNRSGVARLVDIYKNLTVLPSVRKEYTMQEFARDVYLLDEARLSETTGGLRMRLHPGATSSKSPGQLLRVVDRAGAEKTYYGVEFVKGRQA